MAGLRTRRPRGDASDSGDAGAPPPAKRARPLEHPPLVGMASQAQALRTALEHTQASRESNAVLVIGPPGSGKTALVRHVLARADGSPCVVYLSGLLHSAPRHALEAIARALEIDARDDGEAGAGDDGHADLSSAAFARNLGFLVHELRRRHAAHRALVVVLDEFDLFVSEHQQAVLYNLCDLAHSPLAALLLIGVTARLDVFDALEKRVRSRFMHRQIRCFPPGWAHTEAVLAATSPDLGGLAATLQPRDSVTRDMHDSLNTLALAHALAAGAGRATLVHDDLASASAMLHVDAWAQVLAGLSLLELCLVVALARLRLRGHWAANFAMAYAEYQNFARRGATADFFTRAVSLKAFEGLDASRLIVPHGARDAEGAREHQFYELAVGSDQVLAAVRTHAQASTAVVSWAMAPAT